MSTFSLYKRTNMGIGVGVKAPIYVTEWVASGMTPPQVYEKIKELHPDGDVPADHYTLIEEWSA